MPTRVDDQARREIAAERLLHESVLGRLSATDRDGIVQEFNRHMDRVTAIAVAMTARHRTFTAATRRNAASSPPARTGAIATVLLIDDDDDSREILARFLEKAGHTVYGVASGSEAFGRLTAAPPDAVPDAILLDVRMPGMDGIAVLGVLRAYLRWAFVPIAILTAYPEDPRLWHVGEHGVKRIFAKSRISLDEVLVWVNEQAERAVTLPDSAPPPEPLAGA